MTRDPPPFPAGVFEKFDIRAHFPALVRIRIKQIGTDSNAHRTRTCPTLHRDHVIPFALERKP